MNTTVLSILIPLITVVMLAPRRWALLGMMAGVLYLTQGQVVEMLGFHMSPLRFLEIAGFARVMMRREFRGSEMNRIDWLFLTLYTYTTILFLLRSSEGVAYQIGLAVDATMSYFTFRGLIKGIEDLIRFLRAFCILLLPFVAFVAIESITGYNVFTSIGGLSGHLFREDRGRSVGSFRHPVLLGTLGASFVPLYIGLGFFKSGRVYAALGLSLGIGLVLFSNSGGPLNALFVGIIGWLLWPARKKMFLVRRGMVGVLALLALVMKAPIWYLPAKASIVTGGGGWHRSHLIEMAVEDFRKWWLAGMPMAETHNWFPYTLLSGGADITNQFLSFGLSAGIGAIVLFVLLLMWSFQDLGKTLKALREASGKAIDNELILWGLGIVLSVHIVNWFGVCYFDQIYVVWFMQIAAVSALSHPSKIKVT
jgi:hypothetical protein